MVHTPYSNAIQTFKGAMAPTQTLVQTQQWFDKRKESVPQSQDLKRVRKFGAEKNERCSTAMQPTSPQAMNISYYTATDVFKHTHTQSILLLSILISQKFLRT